MSDTSANEPFAIALESLRQSLSPGARNAQSLIARLDDGSASVEEWQQAAETLLKTQPGAARVLLEVAIETRVHSAPLQYLLGNALRMSARPAEAEIALRKAITLDPGHTNASLSLAYLLREQGRMQALGETMTALWRHEPRTLESDRRTLSFLVECERYVEADALLAPILEAHPHDAGLQRQAGEITLVLGQFERARTHLRAAIEADPSQASAWLRLAHTHRFVDADDPDLQLLRKGATHTDLGLEVESAIGFALGKAFDDLGWIEQAAHTLTDANARWRAAHPWDGRAWQHFVDAQRQQRNPPVAQAPSGSIPIFIVGLPRSGTTLAASLLARDPQLRARGELNWIAALAKRVGAQPTADTLSAAGRLYLSQLRQDDPPASFHIDKNPLNFRHLGLIAAMLPQARIIHCRRDSRDTALSLWSQHFAHAEMAWSYDFDDIAEFARGHVALMQHWRSHLPLPIFDLDYEAWLAIPRARSFPCVASRSAELQQRRMKPLRRCSPLPASGRPDNRCTRARCSAGNAMPPICRLCTMAKLNEWQQPAPGRFRSVIVVR